MHRAAAATAAATGRCAQQQQLVVCVYTPPSTTRERTAAPLRASPATSGIYAWLEVVRPPGEGVKRRWWTKIRNDCVGRAKLSYDDDEDAAVPQEVRRAREPC